MSVEEEVNTRTDDEVDLPAGVRLRGSAWDRDAHGITSYGGVEDDTTATMAALRVKTEEGVGSTRQTRDRDQSAMEVARW